MDSAISTAARALSMGDPLVALKFVALRNDASALALRGIAMAQLGELSQARTLLRRAAASFGDREPLSRARVTVAQAEVALALRDLTDPAQDLDAAVHVLGRHGDRANAAFAQLVQVRRLLLLGEVHDASRALRGLSLAKLPPRIAALRSLAAADLAMRRVDHGAAQRALVAARAAAREAPIPALLAELVQAEQRLEAPVARLCSQGSEQPISLAQLPRLFASDRLIVDGCRREVRLHARVVSLVGRPVLLALAMALAEQPSGVPRDVLITRVFGARRPNDSHRVRLRVEVGRLRKLLAPLGALRATPSGYVLEPRGGGALVSLLPPAEGEASALLALLSRGEAWATSALATAVGKSQRAVQRALSVLEQAGKVQASGKGRARRWVVAPAPGLATTMLLVAPGTLQ